jgi:hypothetical protein
MDTIEQSVYGSVGFYLSGSLPREAAKRGLSACNNALHYFPWLKRRRLQHGVAQLELWSHHNPEDSLYFDKLGNLFVLIGSPMNNISWSDTLERLAKQEDDAFEVPWEGRCVLIRISPAGQDWTMWNDWCGAIPVFHTLVDDVPVASSLEPPVVAAAGFTPDDFSKRGIVEMLVLGHFLGTDTLFTKMHVLTADSVSYWQDGKFAGSKVLWTVVPTDSRWDRGWDELIDEMYRHTVKAIGDALRGHDKWILPLSSGMDSRLIACVGAQVGAKIQAYTVGPATWDEPIHARQLAQTLNIPWQRVDLGTDYLAEYTSMWLDWFGSSLHTHGMYWMPLLEQIQQVDGAIIEGFFGNNTEVLTFDPNPYLNEMNEILESQKQSARGSEYHQMNYLDIWNRQQRFIFYQPMMYDYWKGVCVPYMNREYARFCLSLPRVALENRRLQKEMLKRYFPVAAKIGGGVHAEPSLLSTGGMMALPLLLTKKWLLKAGVASCLPKAFRVGPLRQFAPTPNTMEPDCVAARGLEALYPLSRCFQEKELPWLRISVVRDISQQALNLSKKRGGLPLAFYIRLPPLQTLIYRMCGP